MRGPYNGRFRPDSQPTTGVNQKEQWPKGAESGHNKLQRKPDPTLKPKPPKK